MPTALDYFTAKPRRHNCAQSVMAGANLPDATEAQVAALASCGGGRAPEGRCGALHAAMLLTPETQRDSLCQAFIQEVGSDKCREIKGVHKTPCEQCVAFADAWLQKKARSNV